MNLWRVKFGMELRYYVLPIIGIYKFCLVWNYVPHLACTHIFFVNVYTIYCVLYIHTHIYIYIYIHALRLTPRTASRLTPRLTEGKRLESRLGFLKPCSEELHMNGSKAIPLLKSRISIPFCILK